MTAMRVLLRQSLGRERARKLQSPQQALTRHSIRKANILLIRVKALANEVAKNLVLAGIGSLTIIDDEQVTADDLGAQFFIQEADVGKNRAEAAAPEIRKLNPRVNVHVDTDNILAKPDLAAFFSPFNVIIATDLDFPTTSTINVASRMQGKAFYAGGAHGMYGYIFADLNAHTFQIERKKANISTVIGPETTTRSIVSATTKRENGELKEVVVKREEYTPLLLANTSPLPPEILNNRRKLRQVTPLLPCLRALWDFEKELGRLPTHARSDLQAFTTKATEKHKELQLPIETLKSEFLRSFLQNLGSEVAPVTAFLGGQLAQDVINVLGMREQPIQNFVLFDGGEFQAPVYSLHPIFDDGLDGVVNGVAPIPVAEPVVSAGSSAGALIIDD
jgi:ubiquitin-like 1-activating enzyme E1 A